VLCDIAPLGIAVAKAAGRPAVLVENFTWDWIYAAYAEYDAQMHFYIRYLQELFGAADYHIQTAPVCADSHADLVTQPVSRKPTTDLPHIRQRLGLPGEAKAVMITMGGIPMHYPFMQQLAEQQAVTFIIPGAAESIQRHGNIVLLPHRPAFPSTSSMLDAIIGKVGYNTR
jgi:hypothetical protein